MQNWPWHTSHLREQTLQAAWSQNEHTTKLVVSLHAEGFLLLAMWLEQLEAILETGPKYARIDFACFFDSWVLRVPLLLENPAPWQTKQLDSLRESSMVLVGCGEVLLWLFCFHQQFFFEVFATTISPDFNGSSWLRFKASCKLAFRWYFNERKLRQVSRSIWLCHVFVRIRFIWWLLSPSTSMQSSDSWVMTAGVKEFVIFDGNSLDSNTALHFRVGESGGDIVWKGIWGMPLSQLRSLLLREKDWSNAPLQISSNPISPRSGFKLLCIISIKSRLSALTSILECVLGAMVYHGMRGIVVQHNCCSLFSPKPSSANVLEYI